MPHSLTWEYVDPGKTDESSRFVITRVTTGSPVHSGTTVDRVSTTPGTTSQARFDDPGVKSGAPLAAVIGLLGAVGVAASPVVGVGSGRGVDTTGALASAALFAAVCTIVVPLVAVLTSGRRPAFAGGLLAGIGAVSLGAAILDGLVEISDPYDFTPQTGINAGKLQHRIAWQQQGPQGRRQCRQLRCWLRQL